MSGPLTDLNQCGTPCGTVTTSPGAIARSFPPAISGPRISCGAISCGSRTLPPVTNTALPSRT